VGITAGTSAPETKVQEVLERLRAYGASEVCEMEGERETMHFHLPESL
jgi:4-hydroxy-3-methylbut-2-en-1-yl diphosphate reductase